MSGWYLDENRKASSQGTMIMFIERDRVCLRIWALKGLALLQESNQRSMFRGRRQVLFVSWFVVWTWAVRDGIINELL